MMILMLILLAEPIERPVHTYSIVAYDAETGEIGAAVQSHWFSVGSLVIWAEPGIGAVATQSFVRIDYGPLGLKAMADGEDPAAIMKKLTQNDQGQAVRQVAMVDAKGRVAGHTGANCIDFACDKQGKGYSVQANMMLKNTVCEAMSKAFEATKGSLARRLMAAMEAAQNEGGDIRGKQSAAIKVVKAAKQNNPWEGVVMELRVEDHPHPIKELNRLVGIHEAYEFMNKGDIALENKEVTKAMEYYSQAVNRLPDRVEPIFWQAVNLVNIGRTDAALPLFRRVFEKDKNWRLLIPRIAKVGLIPNKEPILRAIAEQ